MSKKAEPTPEISTLVDRDKLKQGVHELQALAKALDRKIEMFERWMASLEGRVETTVYQGDPEEGHLFGLRLKRGSWTLEYAYTHISESEDEAEWKPLSGASVDTKITAIDAIPTLVGAMNGAQAKLIERVRAADEKLARMAQSIGKSAEAKGDDPLAKS